MDVERCQGHHVQLPGLYTVTRALGELGLRSSRVPLTQPGTYHRPSCTQGATLPNAQPLRTRLPEAGRWVFVVSMALSPAQVPWLPGLLPSPWPCAGPSRPECRALPRGLQNGSLYREPALPLAGHDTQKMEWPPWEAPATLLSGRLGWPALGFRLGSRAVGCGRPQGWGEAHWLGSFPPSA